MTLQIDPSTLDPGASGILDLAGLNEAEEAQAHQDAVRLALHARGIAVKVPLPLASPRREGARARVKLQVASGGRLLVFRPRSHETVEPPLQAMARPEIVAVVPALQARLSDNDALVSQLTTIELRSNGRRVVAVLEARSGSGLPVALLDSARALVHALGPGGAVALGHKALAGNPRIDLCVGGIELTFGPLTFFQVNLEANDRLVHELASWIERLRPRHLIDVFGGAGNLSLPIAARGVPVTLVESSIHAAADARKNARRLGLPVDVIQRDAARLRAGEVFFDAAVLDPPRAGAGPVLAEIVLTRPMAIGLVSCWPTSLARDLEIVLKAGYRLTGLQLHDLFPLTSHVETLAMLER
jgi:tRNA/tmRNA/rRNA uracil-C5-methylase (TrmA/RlmC/RlmD family)